LIATIKSHLENGKNIFDMMTLEASNEEEAKWIADFYSKTLESKYNPYKNDSGTGD